MSYFSMTQSVFYLLYDKKSVIINIIVYITSFENIILNWLDCYVRRQHNIKQNIYIIMK